MVCGVRVVTVAGMTASEEGTLVGESDGVGTNVSWVGFDVRVPQLDLDRLALRQRQRQRSDAVHGDMHGSGGVKQERNELVILDPSFFQTPSHALTWPYQNRHRVCSRQLDDVALAVVKYRELQLPVPDRESRTAPPVEAELDVEILREVEFELPR